MKKILNWFFDIGISDLITFIKRLFGIYEVTFVKKSINASLQKDMYSCEKKLDTRENVREFAKFYRKHKELLYYIAWDLNFNYKNSANAYLKFFEDCNKELDKYKLEDELAEARKKK